MYLRILVEPTPKLRPRVATVAGHAVAYTPAKTRKAEADIKAVIREQIEEQDKFPPGVPLTLSATFTVVKPSSAPKRVKFPVKRPDLDNFLKLCLDSLDKFAFADDSQIVQFKNVSKVFGETPMIEVWIEELPV